MKELDIFDVFDIPVVEERSPVDATCSHRLGTATVTTISESLERILELTLNLPLNQNFDGSVEAYLKIYNKFLTQLKAIDCYHGDKFSFEKGERGTRKLHLHAIIYLPLDRKYYAHGLVETMAEYLCRITRKRFLQKNLMNNFPRYESIPFVLQHSERTVYWNNYIEKNAPK